MHELSKNRRPKNIQFSLSWIEGVKMRSCLLFSGFLQRCVTIWNICVSHGSVVTEIRWGGKWVHLS